MRTFSLRASIWIGWVVLALSSCSQKEKVPSPPPPKVVVAHPLQRELIKWDEYTGRFEAVNRVDVRARVTGYLDEQRFRDGQLVRKGDVLFVIDPRPFQYQLQRIQAQFNLAEKEYARAESLRETRAISQEDLDRRFQELQVAEAALNDAKLNLEFTEITAPIDGEISARFVDVGNLVEENATVLARIVSVDPIHFEFEMSQADLMNYLRLARAGKRPRSDSNPNPIFIKLPDEDAFTHMGRMDFMDNVVDTGTGTILGRALVQNREGLMYPGLFGRARLIGSGREQAVLLPEQAINTDQNRKFVYVVNERDEVSRTYVDLGPTLDNGFFIIRKGLTGNERVVIKGLQRIRATDQKVTPELVPLHWEEGDQMPELDSVPSLEEITGEKPAVSEGFDAPSTK